MSRRDTAQSSESPSDPISEWEANLDNYGGQIALFVALCCSSSSSWAIRGHLEKATLYGATMPSDSFITSLTTGMMIAGVHEARADACRVGLFTINQMFTSLG
jgi:hypothetical protein